ncbi:MAG TPA: TRAP transporter large permease [Nevskiales bacterium]|nr:TRAP transporter large permease [Nevskiales bacterium]
MTLLLALGLVVIALMGAPLFAVIAAFALLGFHSAGVDLSVMAVEFYRLAEMQVLLAIPLFTFAGYLLGESRAPQRLVRVTNAVLGWMPGGLAIVALAVCAFFTSMTGATGITIVAMGALLYPALKHAGYPERFTLGLITTSGSLGLLFAPSLPLIVYGVLAQQLGIGPPITIEQLFLAGILPGLLMMVLLGGYGMWVARRLDHALQPFAWRELRAALWEAKWEVPLPVVVIGGIYGGWFAPSEAAAVTALYVLLVEVLILREIPLRRLPGLMREAMVLVGAILIIVGVSMASTNYMVDAEIPARLFEFIREHVESKWAFLMLLNLFLLVMGSVLELYPALVLGIPLVLPIAYGYDIHPVHLGILFLTNMQIGFFLPPIGMSLVIASYRFNQPILEVCRAALPFFALLIVSLLVITYWPALTLALLGGNG